MSTDGDRLHIVYNGEIYNYRELRANWRRRGGGSTTRCDTEVALHAYAQWGPAAFQRFNGMWAIALLDRRGPRPAARPLPGPLRHQAALLRRAR